MNNAFKVVLLSSIAAGGLIAAPQFGCAQQGVTVVNTNANGAATVASSSPVTPSNIAVGAGNFTTAQVTVNSTATVIAAARTGVAGTGRVAITVCNAGTASVYLGASGVTTTNGMLLAPIVGACATFDTTAAISGIVASGTASVTVSETY